LKIAAAMKTQVETRGQGHSLALMPCKVIRRRPTAYQDLFKLWKDADLDIPILKAAKAKYAKLQ